MKWKVLNLCLVPACVCGMEMIVLTKHRIVFAQKIYIITDKYVEPF